MKPKSGFTLIELSIVLVIIGLLVGGILTGLDLINAAAQSAQISQITKYNTAVNTFRNKYDGMPGDLPDPAATQFGFQSRGAYAGEGDGNGVIEGNCSNQAGSNQGYFQGCGELAVFWQDLSRADLIDASIVTSGNQPNTSGPTTSNITLTSSPPISGWLPAAKLGQGNYVYVMSYNSTNYFVVQLVQKIGWNVESTGVSGAGANAMTVQQAYNIDKKIDDGLPQSGNIIACDDDYDVNGVPAWAAGNSLKGAGGANCAPTTIATPDASTNCYDNADASGNGVAGAPQQYSVRNNANAQNCALSFKFQ